MLTQPMTAKQIAEGLQIPHGSIGHHLHVLEEAGLVRLVAKRAVRNMTANYFVRAARLFDYRIPPEVTGGESLQLRLIIQVRDELAEAVDVPDPAAVAPTVGVRHLRLSAAQARAVDARLKALLDEMVQDVGHEGGQQGPDPGGTVYGLCTALYVAPAYLQGAERLELDDAPAVPDPPDASGAPETGERA
jgi:DNA-binding transcriptional ArsR family regulator